jgi:hypothetical protein
MTTFLNIVCNLFKYLNAYYLIKEYPNIVLSGLVVIDLSKYGKKIEETAKKDTEFFQLIKHGSPGIKANFILDDPTFDPNVIINMDTNEEQYGV